MPGSAWGPAGQAAPEQRNLGAGRQELIAYGLGLAREVFKVIVAGSLSELLRGLRDCSHLVLQRQDLVSPFGFGQRARELRFVGR